MSYEIDYRETDKMYHVLVNGASVAAFPDIGAADKAASSLIAQPVKRIAYDRIAREHVGYLDNEPVVWGSHRDCEVRLDALVFDRLSGRAFVEGR